MLSIRTTLLGALCAGALLVSNPGSSAGQTSLLDFGELSKTEVKLLDVELDSLAANVRFQFGDQIRLDVIDRRSLIEYIINGEAIPLVDAIEKGVAVFDVVADAGALVVWYRHGDEAESIRLEQDFVARFLRLRIAHRESRYAHRMRSGAPDHDARVASFTSQKDDSNYQFSVSRGYATVSGEGEYAPIVQLPIDVLRHIVSKYAIDFEESSSSSRLSIDTNKGNGYFGLTLGMSSAAMGRALALLFLLLLLFVAFRIYRETKDAERFRWRLIKIREAERSRLAADLHDGPIQELILVLRSLASASERWTAEPLLAAVHKALGDVKRQLRDTCMELRPPALDHFGLASASRTLTSSFANRNTDMRFSVDAEDQPDNPLPDAVRTSLYRILQECLNNISKHSNARRAWVQLRREKKTIELVVRDDGVGFIAPSKSSDIVGDHFGLVFARQRAESIGGSLSVDSVPGAGTIVRVVVPLKHRLVFAE